MKRNGNGWEQILKHLREERPLTTFEVSKICGVVHSTVSNWVDEGTLPAYKTPGGHRRIKKKDLQVFLKLYEIPIPDELSLSDLVQVLALKDESNGRGATPEGKEKLSLNNVRNTRNGHEKILIVEDDEAVSEILLETLQKSYPAFEIRTATDGFEAGKQIISFMPDLIILDLILPGVDGFKVLRNLRQDRRFLSTKILAISGFDTSENRERILQAGGVDGFISKPVDLHQLRKQIEKLLVQ